MDKYLMKLRLAIGYEMFPERKIPNKATLDHLIAQIAEELGELRGAIRSYLGRPYSPEKKASFVDVTEEFGDVLGTLLVLGDSFGIDNDEALKMAIEKMQRRQEKINAEKQQSPIMAQIKRGIFYVCSFDDYGSLFRSVDPAPAYNNSLYWIWNNYWSSSVSFT